MHEANLPNHALSCLFLPLFSPCLFSLQVTVKLLAPRYCLLLAQVGLLNVLGFICAVFHHHPCFLSHAGEREQVQAYTLCLSRLGLF